MLGSIGSAYGARKGYKQQKKLTRRYKRELTRLSGQFGDLSQNYLGQFQDLSKNFNLYDMENEFNSLYEAVIQPMEQQFSETVLPQIRQSYSGGGYGSAMFSGGRESSEAKARQSLSMNEAMWKYQGREAGLARNVSEYDRRRQDLGLQFNIEKAPIDLGFQVADKKYGADVDKISAQTAQYGAFGAALDSIGKTAGQAAAGFATGGASFMLPGGMPGNDVGGTPVFDPNKQRNSPYPNLG